MAVISLLDALLVAVPLLLLRREDLRAVHQPPFGYQHRLRKRSLQGAAFEPRIVQQRLKHARYSIARA
jgi:hypothetical protein